MAANVFNIYASLRLNMANFTTQLSLASKRVGNTARQFEGRFRDLSRSMTSLGRNAMLLGGSMAAGFLVGFRTMATGAKEVAEISRQLGISTNAAKQLQVAAKIGGMEFREFAVSISRMQKNLGTGKGDETLKNLGLDPKQIKEMAADQSFLAILDRLADLKSANERTAVAMALFGKAGFQMLRFVKDGKNELREFLAKAQDLGASLSDQKASQLEHITWQMNMLSIATTGLGNKFRIILAPAIDWVYRKLIDLYVWLGKTTSQFPNLTRWLTLGVIGLSSLALGYAVATRSVGIFLGGLANLFGTIPKLFGFAAASWATVAPWLPLAAAITLVGSAIALITNGPLRDFVRSLDWCRKFTDFFFVAFANGWENIKLGIGNSVDLIVTKTKNLFLQLKMLASNFMANSFELMGMLPGGGKFSSIADNLRATSIQAKKDLEANTAAYQPRAG